MAYEDAPSKRLHLAAWRKALGVSTLSELANRSGVDVSILSRAESGKRVPRNATALRIAEGLGISLEQLRRNPPITN